MIRLCLPAASGPLDVGAPGVVCYTLCSGLCYEARGLHQSACGFSSVMWPSLTPRPGLRAYMLGVQRKSSVSWSSVGAELHRDPRLQAEAAAPQGSGRVCPSPESCCKSADSALRTSLGFASEALGGVGSHRRDPCCGSVAPHRVWGDREGGRALDPACTDRIRTHGF